MKIKKLLTMLLILALSFAVIRLIGEPNELNSDDKNPSLLNDDVRVFDNVYDINIDSNMNYIDIDMFESIQSVYAEIDFYGKFNEGNLQSYDYYKEKFRLLINNEVKFIEKDTGKEYYLNEYNEMCNYAPDVYTYLFFDMDGDDDPELSIHDTFTYVFKYIPDSNQYILWYDMGSGYYEMIGSQKITWERWGTGTGALYAFYKLDINGNEEYSVTFLEKEIYNSGDQAEYIHLINLPRYANKRMTMEMKEHGYYVKDTECYYFRVTEDQYNKLTKDYFKAGVLAEQNIQKVTFTYDLLFGLPVVAKVHCLNTEPIMNQMWF